MKGLAQKLAKFIEKRPWWFVIAAVILSGAAIPGVLMMRTESGMDTLVSPSAQIFLDNARYEEQFGGESITVLLEGPLDLTGNQSHADAVVALNQKVATDESLIRVLGPQPIDAENNLFIITPRGNMSDADQLEVVQGIEQFFADNTMTGITSTVVDMSKVVDAIARNISGDLGLLFGLAMGVMVVILFFIFRVRWRLLSLLMVGIGALWTFGIMGYAAVPVSMVTMAVLPILIGLGIDFSIQFHNRYEEELTRSDSVSQAIVNSVKAMWPVVGIALLATVIGFITLYVSSVPMIKDFGVMLAVGVIMSYIVGLFLLNSVLYLIDKKKPVEQLGRSSEKNNHRIDNVLARVARFVVKHPLPIFLIALAAGTAGGIVDQWIPVKTSMIEMIPQDIPELVEMRRLSAVAGGGGSGLDFMVEADDVTDKDFLLWLADFEAAEIAKYDKVVSTDSPTTLIDGALDDQFGISIEQAEQAHIDGVVAGLRTTMPAVVARVISADNKMAGVTLRAQGVSLEETYNLLQSISADAHAQDVTSWAKVGSTALGAQVVGAIIGPRLMLNSLCIVAVLIILLLIYRKIAKTVFIILPVGLVIGLLSLIMYITGIGINPITAIMGILVVGINTEFMVLLTSRYEEEKANGLLPHEAMVVAASRMGRAIIATGITTLGGFGVLIASSFPLMSDFGIITVAGVALCMISAIVVMPPLMVWWDNLMDRRRAKKQVIASLTKDANQF
ncbi:RND family transporter [Chloroflexota bacterium]